jgi:hypothetical protein
MPLSLCFVSGLDTKLATSHTPLIWTRGLNASGTWNPVEGTTGDGHDGGIWGDTGGLIGFIDGSVKWFSSLGENPLLKRDGSGPTANPWEAINPDTSWVFDYRGKLDGSF